MVRGLYSPEDLFFSRLQNILFAPPPPSLIPKEGIYKEKPIEREVQRSIFGEEYLYHPYRIFKFKIPKEN